MIKKRILVGGDLYLNSNIQIDKTLVDLFQLADVSMVNLEAPLIINEAKLYTKAGPNLKQNIKYFNELIDKLNISVFTCANNHIIDYGEKGIKQTFKYLKKINCSYIGAGENYFDASKPFIYSDCKLAILNVGEEEFGVASDTSYGISSMYDERIISEIKKYKDNSYLVIIIAHGGGEEVPLPSNYIRKRYQGFIDAGATLVVGHHPHVIQGVEKFNKGIIYYSIGNFVHTSFEKSHGLLIDITIDSKRNINISEKLISYKNGFLKCEDTSILWKNIKKHFNQIIKNEKLYRMIYQLQSLEMYKSYYKDYFFRVSSDKLLLMHLLRNNSHRDFINQALKIVVKEEKVNIGIKAKNLYKKMVKLIK